MPVSADTHSTLGPVADASRVVTTEWLSANIGAPGVKIVEADEDTFLYDVGHVPGAIKIDWRAELTDRTTHDWIDGSGFAELMRTKGIGRDDTVVCYGDKLNGTAAAVVWLFRLFGHADVRLLDGGREAWISEERDTTFEVPLVAYGDYPVVERADHTGRVLIHELRGELGTVALVDVRSSGEYTGEVTRIVDRPEEQTLRAGHIPTAANVPWTAALAADGRFRTRAELAQIYAPALAGNPDRVVTYCRVGEHAAHTWFVLTELLGLADVRTYDGSWTEWANAVRTPIAVGAEPGSAPTSTAATPSATDSVA
ncbi:sulfurtransferase [Nocardia stercoris]|uniref:Sulfurtransferase n=1 Tax=Nocardia stercoris TaxID=2483361 RepID=A0A3M2L3H8_9NOCA|nr:sulfurtransferase [Nocardia stercoris]RMI31944.1 sulfurtransferase [Nocardia stercoris]